MRARPGGVSAPATAGLNPLDELDATIRACGAEGELTVSAPYRTGPDADVTVIVRRRGWEASGEGRRAIRALAEHPDVAHLVPRGRRLLIRLDDERLAALGAPLEAGAPDPLGTRDLAAGERWVVDFCDPNATKALHVGHLRNVALGHALASAAEAAGARVVRQSQVGDCGRSMGEALAGYLRFGGGATPASAGVKADHLVGDCYARYVAALRAPVPATGFPDAALDREAHEHGDLADELLARLRSGDPEATALWRTVRGWALRGQDATLARLGVTMDRNQLESDYASEMDAVVEAALVSGVATRSPGGPVVHETGRPDHPHLVLERSDGLATQHLRYVALWRALQPGLEGVRSVEVAGDEWVPMVRHGEEVLRRLSGSPGAEVHPRESVLHGMVRVGGAVAKSSDGAPPLIDELLDALAATPDLRTVACSHARADADELAATAALGFFLGRPASKGVTVEPARLLDPDANGAWAMALAHADACGPSHDGDPDPDVEDPRYRSLLVQSQLHRRLLAVALERLDPLALARFHGHLAQSHLAATPAPRVARAMRGVLGAGLAALGLRPPGLPLDERLDH